MNGIRIAFEQPIYLLLLIPSILIIVLPFAFLPKRRRRTFKRLAPMILHLLIVTLLCFILAGVSVVTKSASQTILVLMDCSDSMKDVESEVKATAEKLLTAFDKDVEIGVIAFGENARMVLQPGSSEVTVTEFTGNTSGSDLSNALAFASTKFPDETAARVILLSDGKETNGAAESTAYALAAAGIEIDVLYYDTIVTGGEMQILAVTSEESCEVGDTVNVAVEVKSTIEGPVLLSLYDNEELVGTQVEEVTTGVNLYNMKATLASAGTHSLRVHITCEYDIREENNDGYTAVTASGSHSILLISGKLSATETLASLLSEEGCEVTTVTSKNMPKSIIELCRYDEIILLNVNAEDLPAGADSLLKSYVSTYGRTILAAGGRTTFQYGSMSDTVFEEMLPTEFQLTDTENTETVALMLVLDCSSSMSSNSSNLKLAKQGAVNVVESMSDNDTIGIISFNRSATLRAELTQATEANKAELSRVVSALNTSQGTYYTEALELAYEELLKSDAETRHVIFLSDGSPSDRGYTEAVQQMADAGITVSTIGLGYSSSILESMAETGNGRYYYVSSAKDLPTIMVSETEQVVINSLFEVETPVAVKKATEVTQNVEEESLPSLSGYIGLTAKEDATVLLATGDDRPILTIGTCGLGTTAVFAADLSGDWTGEWFDTEAGRALIRNMCTVLIDTKDHKSTLNAKIDVNGTNAAITVSTVNGNTSDTLTATVTTRTGEETVRLEASGNGTYTTTLSLSECGNHDLVLLQKNEDGDDVDFLITSFAVNYSSEYDAFRTDGETVLLHLTELTGGIMAESVEALAAHAPNAVATSADPLVILAVLIMLMILSDIAIRKIRWKDVQRILGIRKV